MINFRVLVLCAILLFAVILAVSMAHPWTIFVLERVTAVPSVSNHILSKFCFPRYVAMDVYRYVPLLIIMPFWLIPPQVGKVVKVFSHVSNLTVVSHAVVITPAEGQIHAILAVSHFQFTACFLDCFFCSYP
jgi:hypothetical protein